MNNKAYIELFNDGAYLSIPNKKSKNKFAHIFFPKMTLQEAKQEAKKHNLTPQIHDRTHEDTTTL